MLCSIQVVTGNRAPEAGKVYTDLVGPAGLQSQVDQGMAGGGLGIENRIRCDGCFSVGTDNSPHTGIFSADGQGNDGTWTLRDAVCDSQIFPDKPVTVQLAG